MGKNPIKILAFILSYVIVGSFFLFVFNSISIDKSPNVDQEDINESILVNALKSYYGKWEIVEDFGYHGIHRTNEIEKFQVGKVISFYEEVFCYEDSIDVLYPSITIEITSSAEMQQVDKMEYPQQMGFDDQNAQFAKIIIYDSNTNFVCNFYVLKNNEIIIEGDVHRYYRAVKEKAGDGSLA